MISAIIISRNEESVISDCIKSIKNLADEIIVVDDSDDKTAKIAEDLGAKVTKNKLQDFSSQRNLGASLAKNEWIFYIDSDERATPGFIAEVKEKIKNFDYKKNIAGFFV